jgi:hypothetical protein
MTTTMHRSHWQPWRTLLLLLGGSWCLRTVDGFGGTALPAARGGANVDPRLASRTTPRSRPWLLQRSSNNAEPDDDNNNEAPHETPVSSESSRRRRIRKRVADMASKMVPKSIANYAMPEAIASVLKEATLGAVEEVMSRQHDDDDDDKTSAASAALAEGDPTEDLLRLIDEAFLPVEDSLEKVQNDLIQTRAALAHAKFQARDAVRVVQAAAAAQVQGAASAVRAAGVVAGRTAVAEIYATANDVDIRDLRYDDIDFATSEMAPPFLGEDQCLVPGEAVVRVEKAPENSRRIFAGIDILASVDTVWDVLTDYANLQQVVPNLAVNNVQQVFAGKPVVEISIDESASDLEQCKEMASQLKGSVLAQVGGVSLVLPGIVGSID